MGVQHIEFHCLVCLGWVSDQAIRVLHCGHVFCTGCLAGLAALPLPHRCPTCRAEFDHDWTITLYCEIRDTRVRKLRNANKALERHEIDLTDIPSSSRPGSPSQHVDDDDSKGNGYSDTVHSHAASAALRVGSLDESTTSEQMKRAGAEVGNVVKAMGCNPQDNVLKLLKELSTFLTKVAAPIFADSAAKQAAVERKDQEMRKLTNDLLTAKRALKQDAQRLESQNTRLVRQEKKLGQQEKKLEQQEKKLEKALEVAGPIAEENLELKKRISELAATISDVQRQLTTVQETRNRLEAANQARAKKAQKMQKENSDIRIQLEDALRQLEERDSQLMRQRSPSLIIASDEEELIVEPTVDTDDVSFGASASKKLPSPRVTPAASLMKMVEPVASGSRPTFGSNWNIKQPPLVKRKRPNDQTGLPLKFRSDGKPDGALHLGPRTKLNRFN